MTCATFAPTSPFVTSANDVLELLGDGYTTADYDFFLSYFDETAAELGETFYPVGSTADSFDSYSTFDADDYEYAQSRFF
jgi:hypothetical protein